MTHFLQRSALILLGTTALAACTATGEQIRPTYPSRIAAPPAAPPAPETPPPPPVVESTPAPQIQAPPAAVESQALPPLSTAPRAPEEPPPAPTPVPAPVPELRQRPAPPPAPVFETVTRRTVTGKVVTVAGKPVTYTVKKGDTLEKIARKLDTSIEDLRRDNGLKKKHLLQPGDRLKGPAADTKAYVVGAGDTFFSIGKRFGVSVDALRDENDLSSRASIHAGQRLRLPGGYRDHGPVTVTERVPVGSAAPESQAEEAAPPPARAARGGRTPPPVVDEEPQTVSRRTVTGRVVEIQGRAATYKVKKGDNLSKVARKLDTTVEDLRADNRLKSNDLRPGQTLKGPRSTAKAYVAGAGDTLADIARRFGVRPEALRAENGLSRRAAIRPGQKVRLPDGYRDRGPIVTRVTAPASEAPPPARDYDRPAPPPRVTLPSAPQPYTPPPGGTRPYVPPAPSGGLPAQAPVQSAPLSDAQISQIGSGRFIWPLQGDILSAFGPKGGGQKNDGINIQATPGAPVRAAADGSVVYAGDQVPGFGNLVLLQHADGWVTAYGHLSHVDVKNRQKITQGQQIGLAGATGGVPEPQLHFEVRYAQSPRDRAQPIDPRLVLPR